MRKYDTTMTHICVCIQFITLFGGHIMETKVLRYTKSNFHNSRKKKKYSFIVVYVIALNAWQQYIHNKHTFIVYNIYCLVYIFNVNVHYCYNCVSKHYDKIFHTQYKQLDRHKPRDLRLGLFCYTKSLLMDTITIIWLTAERTAIKRIHIFVRGKTYYFSL